MAELGENKFHDSEEQVQTVNKDDSQMERNETIRDAQNLKSLKKQEICCVPIHKSSERKSQEYNSADILQDEQRQNYYLPLAYQESNTKKSNNFLKQAHKIGENQEKLNNQDTENQHLLLRTQGKNTNDKTDKDINTQKTNLNISKEEENSFPNSDSVTTVSDDFEKGRDNKLNRNEAKELNTQKKYSSPLPDIHSSCSKPVPSNQKTSKANSMFEESLLFCNTPPPLPNTCSTCPTAKQKTSSGISIFNDDQTESPLLCNISPPSKKFATSPYIFPDSHSHDGEVELKSLNTLQSLRTNQSIYKLAYDESITDQSEADSQSPSPIDPETQVPKSIVNDEILIHEADSCSDAGSEDVELIPHRYESETFLNESKHMYVNKLSLAVELLRTQENIPYDEQFKRVPKAKIAKPDTIGEVNFGFMDDSSLFKGAKASNQIPHHIIASQSQARNREPVSSFSSNETCSESCEEATEVVAGTANTRDDSEGVRAGYRRFHVQFRHYLTPKAAFVNPCLCCVIM